MYSSRARRVHRSKGKVEGGSARFHDISLELQLGSVCRRSLRGTFVDFPLSPAFCTILALVVGSTRRNGAMFENQFGQSSVLVCARLLICTIDKVNAPWDSEAS